MLLRPPTNPRGAAFSSGSAGACRARTCSLDASQASAIAANSRAAGEDSGPRAIRFPSPHHGRRRSSTALRAIVEPTLIGGAPCLGIWVDVALLDRLLEASHDQKRHDTGAVSAMRSPLREFLKQMLSRRRQSAIAPIVARLLVLSGRHALAIAGQLRVRKGYEKGVVSHLDGPVKVTSICCGQLSSGYKKGPPLRAAQSGDVDFATANRSDLPGSVRPGASGSNHRWSLRPLDIVGAPLLGRSLWGLMPNDSSTVG